VVGLLPTWPEVRCDRCRTVYTIPEHKRTGLVSGNCPKCHHVVFSTTIVGDVPPVTFDFNQFEGDLG
jgi:phage FluMu protein Com